MFERFSDRARRAVVLAQEQSRLLDHDHIGTEHVLLGLLHEGEGLAARALRSLGVTLEAAQAEVEDILGRGGSSPTGHIPFTPRAKKVLELGLREALQLGDNYIGTEHILLGLIREGEGVAAQVLVRRGVDLSRLRQRVIDLRLGQVVESQTPAFVTTELVSRAIDETVREALKRKHDKVGSEHVLLWLLAQGESGAVRALRAGGVDVAALRSRLEQMLDEGEGSTDP
jgi:ATP-dependent Clp protease ATP-binding subunit ClpA